MLGRVLLSNCELWVLCNYTHYEYLVLNASAIFSARCNIYISRLCYDVSVRLSVTEVHCGHGACREVGRGHLTLC